MHDWELLFKQRNRLRHLERCVHLQAQRAPLHRPRWIYFLEQESVHDPGVKNFKIAVCLTNKTLRCPSSLCTAHNIRPISYVTDLDRL